MSKRTITIWSTIGENGKKIQTDAKVWSELKNKSEMKEYFKKDLCFRENINNTDLVDDNAILPYEDFVLFIYPKKVSLGSYSKEDFKKMSFKELRECVKNFGEGIKEFFKNYDKNWTNFSTEELRQALIEYVVNTENETVKEVEKRNAEDILNIASTEEDIENVINAADTLAQKLKQKIVALTILYKALQKFSLKSIEECRVLDSMTSFSKELDNMEKASLKKEAENMFKTKK